MDRDRPIIIYNAFSRKYVVTMMVVEKYGLYIQIQKGKKKREKEN
jgi:hypothetical protein